VTLKMVRGDTTEWDMLAIHPITREPINIQGGTIKMMAKRTMADQDADAVIHLSTAVGEGITIIQVGDGSDGSKGKFHVKAISAQTDALPNQRVELFVDVQVEVSTGKWTVYRDKLVVSPGVVRG